MPVHAVLGRRRGGQARRRSHPPPLAMAQRHPNLMRSTVPYAGILLSLQQQSANRNRAISARVFADQLHPQLA